MPTVASAALAIRACCSRRAENERGIGQRPSGGFGNPPNGPPVLTRAEPERARQFVPRLSRPSAEDYSPVPGEREHVRACALAHAPDPRPCRHERGGPRARIPLRTCRLLGDARTSVVIPNDEKDDSADEDDRDQENEGPAAPTPPLPPRGWGVECYPRIRRRVRTPRLHGARGGRRIGAGRWGFGQALPGTLCRIGARHQDQFRASEICVGVRLQSPDDGIAPSGRRADARRQHRSVG